MEAKAADDLVSVRSFKLLPHVFTFATEALEGDVGRTNALKARFWKEECIAFHHHWVCDDFNLPTLAVVYETLITVLTFGRLVSAITNAKGRKVSIEVFVSDRRNEENCVFVKTTAAYSSCAFQRA